MIQKTPEIMEAAFAAAGNSVPDIIKKMDHAPGFVLQD